MEFKNKQNASPMNIKDLQARFKRIKNTVMNLKKVNHYYYYIKFNNIYRAMKHSFYL